MSEKNSFPCDICMENEACWKLLDSGKYLAMQKSKIFSCPKARDYILKNFGFPDRYDQRNIEKK